MKGAKRGKEEDEKKRLEEIATLFNLSLAHAHARAYFTPFQRPASYAHPSSVVRLSLSGEPCCSRSQKGRSAALVDACASKLLLTSLASFSHIAFSSFLHEPRSRVAYCVASSSVETMLRRLAQAVSLYAGESKEARNNGGKEGTQGGGVSSHRESNAS